jgi:hypothetical protein
MSFIMKIKNVAINLAILVVSVVLSLSIGEWMSRMFLDPQNFMEADIIPDERYGLRISPNQGIWDAWGFRNLKVPETSEFVAIGDSQTYGVSATSNNSWPAQLSRIWKIQYYNLSLGGYGPIQYERLLEDYALRLKPQLVIIGFYFGNDFLDAYNASNLLPVDQRPSENNPPVTDAPPYGPTRIQAARAWLAHHSVVYNLMKYSIFGMFPQVSLLGNRGLQDEVRIQTPQFKMTFTPGIRFKTLDENSTAVKTGEEISRQMFKKIALTCTDQRISCYVMLIPTKESVYYDAIRPYIPGDYQSLFENLVTVEDHHRNRITLELQQSNLAIIDPLPAMKKAIASGNYYLYPSSADGHPNRFGYEIIAQAVTEQVIKR